MEYFKKQLILFFALLGLIGLFSGCNNHKLQCPVCHGTTTVSIQGNMVHCPICTDGKITQEQMDELTKLQPCAWCNGSGYTPFGPCPQCHSMGSTTVLSMTLSLVDAPSGGGMLLIRVPPLTMTELNVSTATEQVVVTIVVDVVGNYITTGLPMIALFAMALANAKHAMALVKYIK